MKPSKRNSNPNDRQQQDEIILRAINDSVRKALRRHMLLGESIAVAGDNGDEVKILGPDEIRKVLEQRGE